MYSTAWSTDSRLLALLGEKPAGEGKEGRGRGGRDVVPEWRPSASLSGISMLNSCAFVRTWKRKGELFSVVGRGGARYLLNGHHDLHGVEAIETEVVGEVGGGLNLLSVNKPHPIPIPAPIVINLRSRDR